MRHKGSLIDRVQAEFSASRLLPAIDLLISDFLQMWKLYANGQAIFARFLPYKAPDSAERGRSLTRLQARCRSISSATLYRAHARITMVYYVYLHGALEDENTRKRKKKT